MPLQSAFSASCGFVAPFPSAAMPWTAYLAPEGSDRIGHSPKALLVEMTHRVSRGEPIELAMTRQDIADYFGLTIETVSRTSSLFERDAIIVRPAARRIVPLRPEALRDLSV